MFSKLQTCSVGEFQRGNVVSPLHFDARDSQKSFTAAADQYFGAFEANFARSNL